MKRIEVPTHWEVPGKLRQTCRIGIDVYDGMDNLRKAAVSGLGLLTLAAITVFIPIIHLFAPLVLTLAAVGLTIRNFTLREIAVAATGRCGACDAEVTAGLGKVKPRYPLWTMCPSCNERLRVLAPESPGEAGG